MLLKQRSFNKEIIDYINLFESLTKAKVKDCYLDNELVFIVNEGDIGKAIGRKGVNIKKIAELTKKRIKVIEFSKDVEKFVSNLIQPFEGKIYKVNDNEVEIEANNVKEKGVLIGRNRKNINKLNKLIKKYYKVEIKVK